MPKIFAYRNDFLNTIPPGGTLYVFVGPLDQFAEGAITVTAHPNTSPVHPSRQLMEVIQMSVRASRLNPDTGSWLDIIVRNNGDRASLGGYTIDGFSLYTSVIVPD